MSPSTPPPVWLQDQYEAATEDAWTLTLLTAAIDSGPWGPGRSCHPDRSGFGWWRAQRDRVLAAWEAGEMRTCAHNPDMGHPEPVFVFLWRPDLIVCQWCTVLANLVSDVEDRTCDGCGRVVAGTPEDPMYAPSMVSGPLTIQTGRCTQCLSEVGYFVVAAKGEVQ